MKGSSKQGYDFSGLLEELVRVNAGPARLTLESSLRDGYYIDHDRKLLRYFDEGGGGWWRMRLFRPTACGIMDVSFPAYDGGTGYVLVYVGRQYDWLFGFGGIWAYKYDGGTLVEVAYVRTWIS